MSDLATESAAPSWPSVGRLAQPLVASLLPRRRARCGSAWNAPRAGATIVDAGIRAAGRASRPAGGSPRSAWAGSAGCRSAPARRSRPGRSASRVSASDPVLACLASQYAGWSLSHGEGDDAYFAMASGPGGPVRPRRSCSRSSATPTREAFWGFFVLETDRPPPDELIARVASDCGLAPSALTFILTPTTSLAGAVQITARVLEVALHKVHALGFPLERVRDGLGAAPLPPPSPDFLTAMGRTNDAILFGGEVQLFVTGPEAEARELAEQAAELGLARLRQAVRPDLQGCRVRLLQDRPDAVQPGPGAGDLPRHAAGPSPPAASRPTCWRSRSAMAPPDVLILGGRPRAGTGAGCALALDRLGLSVARVDFAACGFGIGQGGAGVRLVRGRGCRAPSWCARSRPARFEQVTLRLGLLHALEALGVPVVNAARAIERCVDKSMTSFLLAQAGLPTPPTWAVRDGGRRRGRWRSEAAAAGSASCSSRCSARRGAGCGCCAGPDELPEPEEVGGVYYLQRFVDRADERLARLPGVRGRRHGRGGDDAPRRRLDHQYRPGRHGRAGRRPRPARRARGRGRGGRRRRPCRRRPDRGRGRRACRSSRSTACRPGRGCRA